MGEYHGSLRMAHDASEGVRVVIDLDQEQILIKSRTDVIGRWPVAEVGIRGEDDGFHFRIEGEEVVFSSDDDVGFAIAVGLQSASPRLRRRMGAAFHEA
jgi:hypothetical protein